MASCRGETAASGTSGSPKMLEHFGSPTCRGAVASRSLTLPSATPAVVILLKHQEMTTMTIEQHIEELCAEAAERRRR
jgi:hypothetical protein